MAPSKSEKPSKQDSDLRSFFSSGGSQPKAVSSSQVSKTTGGSSQKLISSQNISKENRLNGNDSSQKSKPQVISLDSDDDEPLIPAPKKTAPIAKSKPVASDDEAPKPSVRKTSTAVKRKTIVASSDEEEDVTPPPKKKAVSNSRTSTKPSAVPSKAPAPSKAKAKKKSTKDDDDDYDMESPSDAEMSPAADESDSGSAAFTESDEDVKPKKRPATKKTTSKTPAKSKADKPQATKEEPKASTSQATTAVPKKFDWAAKKAALLTGPVAHGTKAVPDGAPDALAGLAFVFTGELSAFSRDEAIDLAKRFGGRVTLQPSSKTNYVVLGDNAGPTKLAAIAKHKLPTINEDQFLELIGTRKGLGNGKVDEKTKKKMEKEEAEIKKAAKEMEQRERQADKDRPKGKVVDASTQLWTVRYAPQNLKEICGNKGQIEKLSQWLADWQASAKANFKKPGKHGTNIFRAMLITGPPGIGKTTSAHLCAKLAGYTPVELNASDTRSKKLVENGMNINNSSLDGYIKGGTTNDVGVPITDKTCLIMDEVDGMSAGDRGGVGALNALIKKTKIPIICIANDRQAQKLKPLFSTTYSLPFHKPQPQAIRSRILTIAFKEKMKIPANVIDQLVTGAQSDIRQVLNMMSTWKLSSDTMDFDEGKHLAKMNEKHTILSPFDITSKILGPYVFSPTSRETLGDKMEYYFQDHSFVPLFIQENYLKTQPASSRHLEGPEKILKELRLMDRAASSISDGDIVDSLIHGPEQHWSLMPLHAICSTVTPASCVYGAGPHYGGPNSLTFPQWLGQNSKRSKLNRQLGEVQIRMRLKVSGDKSEIRQSYIPSLFPHIIKPLMDRGAAAVEETIEKMDEYFLSKEDWDTIVELGVDDKKDDVVLKKISTATKTAFTRKYNTSEHPIPFHKAQDLGKTAKKLATGGPAPDLEEAYIDDMEEPSDDEGKNGTKEANDNDDDDPTLDSLIKAPKKKKGASAAAPTASASGSKTTAAKASGSGSGKAPVKKKGGMIFF